MDKSYKQAVPGGGGGGALASDTSGADIPKFTATPSDSQASIIPTGPQLSLPKGGGAIGGLGESFSVNDCTGEATATIPLPISPGRDGMEPHLSLSYASGSGNGPFGMGWTLSNGSITRKTDKGLPCYDDAGPDSTSDVFIFSGAEDLVPLFKRDTAGNIVIDSNTKMPVVEENVINGYLIRSYAPRVQSSFLRIERWTLTSNPSDVHWRITTTRNETTLFGTTAESRIYNPQQPGCISSWLATETFDTKGNALVYDYKAEDSVNVPTIAANEANRDPISRSANRYLKQIRYGNRTPNRDLQTWAWQSAFSLSQQDWMFSVVFDYGEHNLEAPSPDDSGSWLCRLDPFSRYRSGFEVRTYRLCQRILMFHHFPAEFGVASTLVASTDLTYDGNPIASTLTSVVQCGYTLASASAGTVKYTKASIPPVEFHYQQSPSDDQLTSLVPQDVDQQSIENLPSGLDGTVYQWVDLDGEGLSGILTEQGGRWFYKRNTSANNVDTSGSDSGYQSDDSERVRARFEDLSVISFPKPAKALSNGAHFGDVSGSGALDLIDNDSGDWGFYERGAPGKWHTFRSFESFPNIDVNDPNVKFVDLTGDGLPDILLYADSAYTWYSSLAAKGYGQGGTVIQPLDENKGPFCTFTDTEQKVYLADMTGDGLSDLVRIREYDVCYWPNLGYGRFGGMVRMDNAPCFDLSDSFNWHNLRVTDIDGSGTTDIVYLSDVGVDVYINQSGNGFTDAKHLILYPIADSTISVEVIDLLGNGTSCIVWSSSLPGDQSTTIRYLDITRGKKPYLLSGVVNNLGAESRVFYAPSTKFYLQDKEAGQPWITRLPFPVHCVEKTQRLDRISGNVFTSRYTYHHGYFDGVEREFRGFARVEHWDTEDFAIMNKTAATNVNESWHAPPVHTKSWFHTGVYFGGDEISRHLAMEYFGAPTDASGASAFMKTLLGDTVVLADLLSGDTLLEAARALRGRTLRVEVYSEDGSSKSALPYSVGESNFTVRPLQAIEDSHQHSVFMVTDRETHTYHYERIMDDARIQHHLVLQENDYGQPLKSLSVAYGRQPGKSTLDASLKAMQENPRFLYTETDYTNAIVTSSDYYLPLISESRTYELTGLRPQPGSSRLDIPSLTVNGFAAITSLMEIPYEQSMDSSKSQKRLIEQSRKIYRSDDLASLLPLGTIQPMAIPAVSYGKTFTPGLVQNVYKRQNPGEAAENLLPNPTTIIGGTNAPQAGYVDLDKDGSWWKLTGRAYFIANSSATPSQELQSARSHFFFPLAFTSPFGSTSTAGLDSYNLFCILATDAIGNSVSTAIDYRTLRPKLLTDANGNRSAVAYDALGRVAGTALMGKVSENLGDDFSSFNPDISQADLDQFFSNPRGLGTLNLLGSATTRTIYDANRYWQTSKSGSAASRPQGEPCYNAVIARETHKSDTTTQGPTKLQVSVAYSDGFGRVIQDKTQTKAGPIVDKGPAVQNRWIVSGWRIYDNKGAPVKNYEPFFDDTHDFTFNAQAGVSPTMLYDPVGRVVATLSPDHTVSKTVFNAWEETAYDVNDNILMADPRNDPDVGGYFKSLPTDEFLLSWYNARISGQMGAAAQAAAAATVSHANTPSIAYTDVLGRKFYSVANNGQYGSVTNRTDFDIEGNVTAVYDGTNRMVTRYDYDMGGNRIHQASMDAGEKWLLHDVMGNVLYAWNSRKYRTRFGYDVCRRNVEFWLSDDSGSAEKVVQKNIYAETISSQPELKNQRARIVSVQDQSGTSNTDAFDFKGNIASTTKTIATTYKDILDWSDSVPLETTQYVSTFTYDALNRTITTTLPDKSITQRSYDETSQLNQVVLNLQGLQGADTSAWKQIITGIDYNAKLQTTSTTWGNGVITTRVYDAYSFRLTNLKNTRPSTSGTDTLQDLSYTYDPIGNVTNITDNSQQTVYFRNNRVSPSSTYTYDPIYRLVQATGRENLAQPSGTTGAPTAPMPFDPAHTGSTLPGDGSALGTYAEAYAYDVVGNILSIAHTGSDPSSPGWTRKYSYQSASLLEAGKTNNRLTSTSVGSATETYKYDGSAGLHGNMTSMPHLQSMQWDYRDQLAATTAQKVTKAGLTPETTYYVYDAGGQRIRKITISQAAAGQTATTMKERLYIGGFQIFRRYAGDGTTINLERTTVEIFDGQKQRVALAETRTQGTSDPSPQQLLRYQLGNHIGSAVSELDDQARILTYEEYYPFGGTSYQASNKQTESPKRYAYTGKERDEESGLYHCGSRYYAAWLGRWTAADPTGVVDGPNVYAYVRNNPTSNVDPTGNFTVHWDEVGKGVRSAALEIVVVVAVVAVVVATGGAALAPLAAAAGMSAGAIATTGAVITGAIGVAGVAMGAAATYSDTKAAITGKDEKGVDLSDEARSQKIGSATVNGIATAFGARALGKAGAKFFSGRGGGGGGGGGGIKGGGSSGGGSSGGGTSGGGTSGGGASVGAGAGEGAGATAGGQTAAPTPPLTETPAPAPDPVAETTPAATAETTPSTQDSTPAPDEAPPPQSTTSSTTPAEESNGSAPASAAPTQPATTATDYEWFPEPKDVAHMDRMDIARQLNLAAPYEQGLPERLPEGMSRRTASHYSEFMKEMVTEWYNLPKDLDLAHGKPSSQTAPGEWIPRLFLETRRINRGEGWRIAGENLSRRFLGEYARPKRPRPPRKK